MSAAALFWTGFVSLVGQIVLLRELSVTFYGVELIYLVALGVWLGLTALGTLAGRNTGKAVPGRLAAGFLLFALGLPLGVVFLRASRLFPGGVPGAYLPFFLQLAVLACALAPGGVLSGWLFRTAAGLHAGRGRTLATAYGWESAGALAGGLLATCGLRLGVQNLALSLLCALAAAAGAGLLFRGRDAPRGRLAAVCVAVLAALLLWNAHALDRTMTAWNHPGLLDTRDSPYGRVTVTALAGQMALFVDDALVFETQGTGAAHFAHLSALQHAAPRQMLVLGGGMDGTIRELLRHRPARIDAVESDRVLVGLLRSHLPGDLRLALAHPAVRLIGADPRRFLTESSGAYDLILVDTPEPASGRTNRFYTADFFRECAARLAPGGIVGFRLPAAENFWTPQMIGRTASIRRALAVFPEVLTLPGTTAVFTASRSPLPRSPEVLVERLEARGITGGLVTPAYLRYLFANDRRADWEARLGQAAVPANTDLRPACYPYAILIWLSRFFPEIARADVPGLGTAPAESGKGWWLLGCGAAGLFLASRWRPSWRRVLLVAVAGFIGIVFESALLLAYQAKAGALYQDIGCLLMAFMAGLTLGAALPGEAIRVAGLRRQRARWWATGLLGGFALLGLAVRLGAAGNLLGGLASAAALLAAAGFCVAGLFAYASLSGVRHQEQVIAPLYAADLLGGALGSLLGSLVLIPLWGLANTAEGMSVLALLACLLI